jgi:hypothetical protein
MKERPALSPHVAHVLETESPLHAWTYHRLLGGKPKPATPAMTNGAILHDLFLEGGRRIVELDFADYRKREAQDARDAALAAGKLPCLSEKLNDALVCVKRWRENLEGISVNGRPIEFAEGECEVKLEWEEEDVLCHGRVDWLQRDRQLVIDLKTVEGNSSPRACAAKLFDSPAVIQDHAYRTALELEDIDFAGRWTVLFLFAQTVEPYALTPIVCGATMREIGCGRWRRAKSTWAQCLRTNRWPSYGTAPIEVSAPAWAVAREMHDGEQGVF